MPYANITEPFVTYFDGEWQRQSIGYWSNMDLYIYLPSANMSYSINPVVTTMTCTATPGPTSLTTFLPDTTNMTWMGTRWVNSVNCNWFEVSVQNQERLSTYDLYVSLTTGYPVQYHMLGFDSLLGASWGPGYGGMTAGARRSGQLPAPHHSLDDTPPAVYADVFHTGRVAGAGSPV